MRLDRLGYTLMTGPKYTKGQRQVPHHSAAHTETKQQKRLAHYRAKAACTVNKAVGDPEEVCEDGIAVFKALAPARARANDTALKDDD